jgi:hypothetical protein
MLLSLLLLLVVVVVVEVVVVVVVVETFYIGAWLWQIVVDSVNGH